MREIEFRGISKDSGNWFYGNLVIYHRYSKEEKKRIPICYINGGGYQKEGRVITNTIGQYTGLKDKNGTKIFEGDIVKLDEDEVCFIKWDEYDYSYRIKNKEVDDILCGFRPKDFEVIGNIYENPELLEVGQC